MIPNAVRPAQATNDHTAGIALRSARYARPPPHNIPVRMNPWASITITPASATKSGATPSIDRVVAAPSSRKLACDNRMRPNWAMFGNMANVTAIAWRLGTAWNDCSAMSAATNIRIGTSAALGNTAARNGMYPSMPPSPTNSPVASVYAALPPIALYAGCPMYGVDCETPPHTPASSVARASVSRILAGVVVVAAQSGALGDVDAADHGEEPERHRDGQVRREGLGHALQEPERRQRRRQREAHAREVDLGVGEAERVQAVEDRGAQRRRREDLGGRGTAA
jgi:hypothetical protein